MQDVDPIARDPRLWPAFAEASTLDGATAFAFVIAASTHLPGLVEGFGAPVLDPLLERPGFVAPWRAAASDAVTRSLGFRLAFLGLVDADEVSPSEARVVAEDLVQRSWEIAQRPDANETLDAIARVFGAAWRDALSRAVRAGGERVPVALVRYALPATPEEHAALALASDDPFALYERCDEDARWLALAHEAHTMTGHAPTVTAARVAAFVLLTRAGRAADPRLFERAALERSGEYPEEPSELVTEALAALPNDMRAAHLVAPPFAWKYAQTSREPNVIEAAAAALDVAERPTDRTWAIRAFHAWGARGRAALDASASPFAREVASTLDAFAQRRPRVRVLEGLPDTLREAIEAAMDALDADPAGWPARRLQFRVLDFGEPARGPAEWTFNGSWPMVESYAKLGNGPLLAHSIRGVGRGGWCAKPAVRHSKACEPRMLIALGRMILPAWEIEHPGDLRPHRVLEDAVRVLAGHEPTNMTERRELHAFGYADETTSASSSVALTAVWAHSSARDDGENDVQDTAPDLAVIGFTAIPANGETRAERARAFWERFFLEIVPSSRA